MHWLKRQIEIKSDSITSKEKTALEIIFKEIYCCSLLAAHELWRLPIEILYFFLSKRPIFPVSQKQKFYLTRPDKYLLITKIGNHKGWCQSPQRLKIELVVVMSRLTLNFHHCYSKILLSGRDSSCEETFQVVSWCKTKTSYQNKHTNAHNVFYKSHCTHQSYPQQDKLETSPVRNLIKSFMARNLSPLMGKIKHGR